MRIPHPTAPAAAPAPGPPIRALALALCCLLGSCVSLGRGDARRLLDAGFRTPEQTFETFQLAVAGDLPDWEYSCLSSGFLRRNGLSQQVYREGRRRLLEKKPWIRWIARAKVVSSESLGTHRHRITAEIHCQTIAVELVRDDFIEVYARLPLPMRRPVYDDFARFEDLVELEPIPGTAPSPEGGPPPSDGGPTDWIVRVTAFAELPEGVVPQDVSEIRIGQDWKIDELYDPDTEPNE